MLGTYHVAKMLGTYLKAFSKEENSQGYFPRRQLPKSVLPQHSAPYPILATALGLYRRRQRWKNVTLEFALEKCL